MTRPPTSKLVEFYRADVLAAVNRDQVSDAYETIVMAAENHDAMAALLDAVNEEPPVAAKLAALGPLTTPT